MSKPLPYDLDKVLFALLRVGWHIKTESEQRLVFEREGHADQVMIIGLPPGRADSQNGVPLRLTHERWAHIIEGHPEVVSYYYEILNVVRQPERIYAGNHDELLAVREVEPGKWLVVVYRESNLDMEKTPFLEVEAESFIITAYLTRRIRSLEKRQRIL